MSTFVFVVLITGGMIELFKGVFRAGFGTWRTMRLVGRIGEKGARLLYTAAGFALIVIALVIYF